jgi:HTH-type transcriptional regulator, sugar sensing transcriptional regulator
MDITILKKLKLTDKEIAVYLKLLEYGAISVRSLAEIAGLNRGTTYDILKRLQDMNLVSYYHTETRQRFVAEDPERLLSLAEHQAGDLKKTKEKIREFIPELKSLQDKGGNRPITKLYEGKTGIRFILDDLLATLSDLKNLKEREYYIYSATNSSNDINKAFPHFTKERIKRKIHVKAISLAEGGRTSGLDERRWIGTNEESATFVIIYTGKCAYISRDALGLPVGVIIENQNIYDTQKTIFFSLWNRIS